MDGEDEIEDAAEDGGCGSNDVRGETSNDESIDANDGWYDSGGVDIVRVGSIIFDTDCDFNTGDFLITDMAGLMVLTVSNSADELSESEEKRSW